MNWRAHATKSFPSSLVQIQYFPKIFNGSTEYPISLQNYSIYISNELRISHGRDCGTLIHIFKHETETLLLYLYFYKVTAISKPPICSKSSICLPKENYFWQWFHDIRLRPKSKNQSINQSLAHAPNDRKPLMRCDCGPTERWTWWQASRMWLVTAVCNIRCTHSWAPAVHPPWS